jgi:DNA-binding beta-propeller fold protein YncE
MVAIQGINTHIKDVDGIENIYITIDWDRVDKVRQKQMDSNPFDYVLEQDSELTFDITISPNPLAVYTDILNSNDITRLKTICGKIKIKESILSEVKDITEEMVGVHIRLTDMNALHPNYGKGNTTNYVNKINEVLKDKDNKKIFVASDNEGSLNVIKNNFEVINNEVGNRAQNENNGHNYMKYLRGESASESLWIDSFLEMISLSRCGELVYKVSNLNNTSVIFSTTIKKTYRI